jgi:hypothetical protein
LFCSGRYATWGILFFLYLAALGGATHGLWVRRVCAEHFHFLAVQKAEKRRHYQERNGESGHAF